MDRPFLPAPDEIRDRLDARETLPLKELYQFIWRGAFPAIALNDHMDRDLFYSSYVQTYLQRDVRDLSRVGDEMAFLRFIRAASARTAQILNLSELARDADIAPNTANSRLSILQASGIACLLEPYHTNGD
jgi:predicted AAA+ superfamily ATPase